MFPPFRWMMHRRRGLRTWIISILANTPKNGAEIMDEIETMTQGWWRPSPGSVYPLLDQMTQEELLKKRDDGRYELTAKAKEELEWPFGMPGRKAQTVEDMLNEMVGYASYLEDLSRSDRTKIAPYRESIKRSSAVPFIVWSASLYATSRGSPDRTPPSIIECARAAMNPGPLPLRPVTASSIGSSTIVTRPIAPKISSTTSASCSVALRPNANAVAPSPTAHARFGMIRKTRPRPESAFSTNAVRTPAASVMISMSRFTWPAIPATREGMSFGFAARTRMSDSRARSATVSSEVTPCFAAISFARAGIASLTRIREAGTTRLTIKPRTSASPILPTPAIPIVFWVSMRSAPRRVPEKTQSFLLLFRPWKLY